MKKKYYIWGQGNPASIKGIKVLDNYSIAAKRAARAYGFKDEGFFMEVLASEDTLMDAYGKVHLNYAEAKMYKVRLAWRRPERTATIEVEAANPFLAEEAARFICGEFTFDGGGHGYAPYPDDTWVVGVADEG
jgi:hypothetical protein